MDYGPFGFIEQYERYWNMWVGGAEKYGFMNQPNAAFKNFQTLAKAMLPLLDESHRAETQTIVEDFGKLFRSLRLEYGRSFDEVKPYADATQQLKEASKQLWIIASELAQGASEESPAHCERYAHTLQAWREAREALDTLRTRVGETAIRNTMPCFTQLEHQREVMASEHARLQQLAGATRDAKDRYCESLRELEKLSDGMHRARSEAVQVS